MTRLKGMSFRQGLYPLKLMYAEHLFGWTSIEVRERLCGNFWYIPDTFWPAWTIPPCSLGTS